MSCRETYDLRNYDEDNDDDSYLLGTDDEDDFDNDVDMSTFEVEGGSCPFCHTKADYRSCDICGKSAWIIDCGHYDQPRTISGDESETTCGDCWAEKREKEGGQ
jgi:hypothetical protein